MILNIHYGHIGRTASIDTFVQEQVKKLVERYQQEKSLHFEVWVESDHSSPNSVATSFKAGIELRRPNKPTIFVKKTAENFYAALKNSLQVINRKLRQEHVLRKKGRHEIPTSIAED